MLEIEEGALQQLEVGVSGKVVLVSDEVEVPMTQVDVNKLDPTSGIPPVWILNKESDTLDPNCHIEVISLNIHGVAKKGQGLGPGMCFQTEDYSLWFIEQEYMRGIKGLLPI